MRKVLIIFLIDLVYVYFVNSKNIDTNSRTARGIRGYYTTTLLTTEVVTSLVPSSCVLVDPTLLPCRNVRYLKFPNFAQYSYQKLDSPETKDESNVHITPLGWGEYLGIYAPTVTLSSTKIETTVVEDPRIVVTYAVKGCYPVKLPMDINKCSVEAPSTLAIQEILPTSTVLSNIQPSVLANVNEIVDAVNNYVSQQENYPLVESSASGNVENVQAFEATEALPTTVTF